jgi:uncharacterized protein YggT (Ycf19 family)
MIDFFNSLILVNASEITNEANLHLLFFIYVSLNNLIFYLILLLRFYCLLCFTKVTVDSLPMLNPYIWPFSVFRVLTQPYFAFWSKVLPSIKVANAGFDISIIMAIEILNLIIFLLNKCRFDLVLRASSIADILGV